MDFDEYTVVLGILLAGIVGFLGWFIFGGGSDEMFPEEEKPAGIECTERMVDEIDARYLVKICAGEPVSVKRVFEFQEG